MRIYAHRTDYRHNGSFAAYVRRIALNACYDEYRRVRRIREIPLEQNGGREDSSEIHLKAVEQSPDAVAADNERDELIRKALFSLPESIGTRKSDIDAFAEGKMDFDKFSKQVEVIVLSSPAGLPANDGRTR